MAKLIVDLQKTSALQDREYATLAGLLTDEILGVAAHTPIMVPGDTGQHRARLCADGADVSDRQYEGRPCQSPLVASVSILNQPVTAFTHTFTILSAAAGVNGSFRHPQGPTTSLYITSPFMISQQGPSFSMHGRVQAPPRVAGYRVGVIQQIIQSQRQAHYNSLTVGTPWKIKTFTTDSGLDVVARSIPPWYDSSRNADIVPAGLTGLADDPGNDLVLIVNDQGGIPQVGGPPPVGKLVRFSGCSQYRLWLVIEAPDRRRQAIAWAEWVANFDIAYTTVFTSMSAGPPTTTATCSVLTGWMTAPLQIGAGPPIPQNVSRGHTVSWPP